MRTGIGKRLAVAAAALALGGCASLQSVSLSDVPSDRSRPVVASKSSWSVFWFYLDNDFADDVIEELRQKCPDGNVAGVYTKLEDYFYLVVTERSLTARGYCVRQPAPGP